MNILSQRSIVITMLMTFAVSGTAQPQTKPRARDLGIPFDGTPGPWNAITDVESFPSWRADVTRVERVQHPGGRTAWVEEGRNGRMTLAVERSEPPRLLVLRIADRDLPFGGTWTYAVEAVDGGSRLTITENGEIYNPVFRFMARFVFGYEATMEGYLAALGKRLEAGS